MESGIADIELSQFRLAELPVNNKLMSSIIPSINKTTISDRRKNIKFIITLILYNISPIKEKLPQYVNV